MTKKTVDAVENEAAATPEAVTVTVLKRGHNRITKGRDEVNHVDLYYAHGDKFDVSPEQAAILIEAEYVVAL